MTDGDLIENGFPADVGEFYREVREIAAQQHSGSNTPHQYMVSLSGSTDRYVISIQEMPYEVTGGQYDGRKDRFGLSFDLEPFAALFDHPPRITFDTGVIRDGAAVILEGRADRRPMRLAFLAALHHKTGNFRVHGATGKAFLKA